MYSLSWPSNRALNVSLNAFLLTLKCVPLSLKLCPRQPSTFQKFLNVSLIVKQKKHENYEGLYIHCSAYKKFGILISVEFLPLR